MKTLVLYYSFEGNSRYIAEAIAAELDADLEPIVALDEPRTKGFGKFLWFTWHNKILGRLPRLAPLHADVAAYDLLILGGPVWAGVYAPAVKSWLRDQPPSGQTIAPFCCAGGGAGQTLTELPALLPDCRILEGLTLTGEIAGQEAARDQALAWARATVAGLA